LTKDTLFVVQRKYLDAKLKLTRQLLAEKREAERVERGARERRALNKEADEAEKLLADLEEFARRLKAITERGYDPDINDGVILNMAPLREVIPSWSKEPQKYWDGLARGDYDWAHIAMKHWPERVRQKCRTDKSLAVAHGAG
ncbi:MAG: SAM-dependent methyltransferase, partial [Acidobacteria bacterium]|nr:SAM-dependent methyltransferase [Acidobacteriota bacterium]